MKTRPRNNSALVYSTDGRKQKTYETLGKRGGQTARATPKDGIVRVGRETKGRKGKGVTTVAGAPLDAAELEMLAKELKGLCGAGGTVRSEVIEIQGDHRDRIVEALQNKGWTVKRAGG
jgi:translation initiation factor 1